MDSIPRSTHAEKDKDRRWGVGLWRIFRLQIQACLPATTFLRAVDLSGKTIIPFCTHGGGGFGHMLEDYRRECATSDVREGIALKGGYSLDELRGWLGANARSLAT